MRFVAKVYIAIFARVNADATDLSSSINGLGGLGERRAEIAHADLNA